MGKRVTSKDEERALIALPVTVADLHQAIEWLNVNEAFDEDDDEGFACRRVVRFLTAEIERRETRAVNRTVAKEMGVSETTVRKLRKIRLTMQPM